MPYRCHYHVVWYPKYRRKVITSLDPKLDNPPIDGDPGPVDERLKQIIREVCRKPETTYSNWKPCPTTCISSWTATPSTASTGSYDSSRAEPADTSARNSPHSNAACRRYGRTATSSQPWGSATLHSGTIRTEPTQRIRKRRLTPVLKDGACAANFGQTIFFLEDIV